MDTRASLLVRIRDRSDDNAWREFDGLYRPLLMKLARACGLTNDDAEDVVQRCMVSLTRHIQSFDYEPRVGRFRGFLRTLVNNEVRDVWRRRRRADAGQERIEARPSEPPPEEVFDRVWMQEHLHRCLADLRGEIEDVTYQAFRAHVIDDRSIPDVCAEFAMTPNQLYLIKWRTLGKLRRRLRDLLGDEDARS